jgi:hypothetical protein
MSAARAIRERASFSSAFHSPFRASLLSTASLAGRLARGIAPQLEKGSRVNSIPVIPNCSAPSRISLASRSLRRTLKRSVRFFLAAVEGICSFRTYILRTRYVRRTPNATPCQCLKLSGSLETSRSGSLSDPRVRYRIQHIRQKVYPDIR